MSNQYDDQIATLIDERNGEMEKVPGEHEYVWLEHISEEEYLRRTSEGARRDLNVEHSIIDTDNRDLTSTVLVFEDESWVEVDPWELVENVIENAIVDHEPYTDILTALREIVNLKEA